MYIVEPELGWEVPLQSSVLVASALAHGRPVSLAGRPRRLNGRADDIVVQRYARLVRVWEALPSVTASDLADLARLEGESSETGFPAWETLVMRTGADDAPRVVEAARGVWEALGSNEYARHLRPRPNTGSGFAAGRAWMSFGVLGIVFWGVVAAEVQDRWGLPWWVFIPVIVSWPVIVVRLFLAHYRRLERIGGRELPHF